MRLAAPSPQNGCMGSPRRLPALVLAGVLAGCGGRATTPPPSPSPDPQRDARRADALRRAQVWHPPAVPVAQADLGVSNGPLPDGAEIECDFELRTTDGMTPKFWCRPRDGQHARGRPLKVKYGRYNREVKAEVAATRLLAALGFGADHMSVAKRVRCHGCPAYPYARARYWDAFWARVGGSADFEDVAVEIPLEGHGIEGPTGKGWSFVELAQIDPAQGGAPRAHVDALRIVAMLLHDWDNKAPNQRLACLSGRGDAPCANVLALLQDVGATFGPHSLDLAAWRGRPFWADAATCRLSMHGMPFDGATFEDVRVSEEGRAFAAKLLTPLTRTQVRRLFAGARFDQYPYDDPSWANLDAWTDTLLDKVRQIAEHPGCPPL